MGTGSITLLLVLPDYCLSNNLKAANNNILFVRKFRYSKIGVLRSQRRHGTPRSESTHAIMEDKTPTETMALSSQPPHTAQDAEKKSQRRQRRRVRYDALGSSVDTCVLYAIGWHVSCFCGRINNDWHLAVIMIS